MRIRPLAIVTVLAFSLTACASAPETTGSPSALDSSPSATSSPSSSSSSLSGGGISSDALGVEVSGPLGQKPTVTLPKGFGNVDHLIVKDIVLGNGAAVQATDNLTVHYVGIGATTGQQFDASWEGGTPASFPLNGVILGWQQGMLGMKVGGRRLLIIPGDLAYGPNSPDPTKIKPNETLVFVVDLVSIP